MNKNEEIQKWQILILGLMMIADADVFNEFLDHDNILAEFDKYERMKEE